MADLLVNLANNPTARSLLSKAGLPMPTPLRRTRGPWTDRPLEGKIAAVGGAQSGLLHGAISRCLARAGAQTTLVGLDEAQPAFAEAAEAWGRPLTTVDAPSEDLRPDLLVFDGSGLSTPEELRQLYAFFHPLVRAVRSNGRVVVLGLLPEEQRSPGAAAAQAALDGFVRSLGKELGRKGVTVNRIAVGEDAEDQVEPALRWLLSPRSTFVDLQTLRLSPAVPAPDAPPFTRPLDGQVAVVTGAARGIGAATARRMAEEGAKVIVVDRPDDLEAAAGLARELKGLPLGLDVTDPKAGEILAALLADQGIAAIDVLVHNAGVTRDRTLGRMDPARWDLTLDVNLAAPLRLTADLDQRGLIADNGRVVLLSSIAGLSGNMGQTNYAASKAGLVGALHRLAPAFAARGITVNAIAPGFIETRLTAAIPVAIREVARRLSALSQGGLPVDVAEAILFLSSPGAAGLSGTTLRVCGGSFIGA